MIHVALIIPGLDRIGGAESQVILLAKGLRRRGLKVSVVALSGTGGQSAAELSRAGVAFVTLEMRKGVADPRGWIRFNRWLQSETPNVVHSHLAHAAFLARWSRLAAPVPVVLDTLHSSATGPLARRVGYRLSNWLADRVTAVSRAVADAHTCAAMAAVSNLTVLPNGVDVEAFKPDEAARNAFRRELGLDREFLWFAAGRLEPVKDYPTLLRAMVHAPEQTRLFIAGSGPLENELRQMAARLGLTRRVRFLGFEPDVKRWLQAADGFVLASLWEGLPMGLLEASACALPSVATHVPGTREVVVEGQTGWLVPPRNPAALAEAMTRMMQTAPRELKAMAERARTHVAEHYSLDAVLDQWEALYAELLQHSPRSVRWAHTFRSGRES